MSAESGPTLAAAVSAALEDLTTQAKDRAAARLAVVYAEAIDADPAQLGKLGGGLLAVLESLGMSPRSRAAILGKHRGGGQDAPARSRLDELRKRRRARADGA